MNKMEHIAGLFGKELEEEFEIIRSESRCSPSWHKFTSTGFYCKYQSNCDWISDSVTLTKLLTGEYKIKWQPKYKEEYSFPSFTKKTGAVTSYWSGDKVDYRIMKNVGVYETPEEAQEVAREWGWIK